MFRKAVAGIASHLATKNLPRLMASQPMPPKLCPLRSIVVAQSALRLIHSEYGQDDRRPLAAQLKAQRFLYERNGPTY